MRKVPEKQKTRLKERFFETSHKQVMYPRYHSNCALEKGAPLQAPASPMHSRGSHGRRLLIPAGGMFGPPARKGSELEVFCCRARTSARLSENRGPRPSSSSLFLFTCWEVYTLSPDLSRKIFRLCNSHGRGRPSYGLHFPQGSYPCRTNSSLVPWNSSRLLSLIDAAPEHSGRWNFLELVFRI